MRQRFRRNEDWCPECGHLLPKKNWNCPHCGWTSGAVESYESEIYLLGDYSDSLDIPNVDRDIDRLIDNR